MLTAIQFEDGLVLRGRTDDELVADAEAHIRDVHPRLAGVVTRGQILIVIREAPFAMRENGIDLSMRLVGRCPFERWELMLLQEE